MQIIKDKKIIADTWSFIADDSPLQDGDICVSMARWKKDAAALKNHAGKLGVRLTSTDSVMELADTVTSIDLVELDFPAFTDGRGFSQARLLRHRLNYQGEIRATGKFMADQTFYMSRVGINAFTLQSEIELQTALSTLNDFSVNYQPSTN
jgi:uncharacterized protein (DUF934 family)